MSSDSKNHQPPSNKKSAMKTPRPRVLMSLGLLVSSVTIAGTFLGGTAFAQTPTWKPELLGTPPLSWSLTAPVAVNDSGLVAGNTFISGFKSAWIVGPEQPLELLPLPAGTTFGEAFDINSSGVVAGGIFLDDGTSRGVLWLPEASGYEIFLLPSGPGGFFPFNARGINDAGDVVGKYGILGGS